MPDPTKLRVASVPTAVEGDVLPALARAFQDEHGVAVEVTATPGCYELARRGEADLVISHYGHHDAEDFVQAGQGEWPRTVFSNQMALVGPPSDPANVRGLDDAAEALRRIAASGSPFVVNDLDGVRYLVEILWNAIGRPPRDGWMLDPRERREDAMQLAARVGGYSLWGLTPFLRNHKSDAKLVPLVLGDPLLQRMMVTVVVRPDAIAGVNADGARAFQRFLLSPSTQARIRATRYPTDPPVCWVAGGRHNRTAILPSS